MRSIRLEQVLLLLAFVLVPLFNLLVRWLRRRASGQQRPPAERRTEEAAAREARLPASMPPRPRVVEPAPPHEGPRRAPPASPPQPVIRRAGPLGGRAAVRRAVVAMTILGSCRALEELPPRPAFRPPRQVPSRRP